MSKTSESCDFTLAPENANEELVYSLKQGLSLSDVGKDGTVFDLDAEKDLADFSFPKGNDYFNKDCIFEHLTYPEDSDSDTENSQDEQEPFEKIRAKMEPLIPDKGVMKRIRKSGYGGLPPEKAQVTVHYNAYLEFIDEPFDSTRLRKRPMRFILNDGGVLFGLDLAVGSMRQSEVAEFLIAPKYGLGEMGCPPRIPPNATILYVVELLEFVECAAVIEFEQMNSEERSVAPFSKVLEVCKAKNREANALFTAKQYSRCLRIYNKAINLLTDVNMANIEEEKQQQSLLLKLYCNLSQCFLNMNAANRAIPCALSALKIDPLNSKALFRCGKACRLNGEFQKARHYLQKIARKEPSNVEVIEEIKHLNNDIEKYSKLERDFCTKIFNTDPSSTVPKPQTKDFVITDEFRLNLEKHLLDFKNSDIEFLPFTAGFSDYDIEAIRKIATDMGLHCVVPNRGDAKMRVYRTKPDLE